MRTPLPTSRGRGGAQAPINVRLNSPPVVLNSRPVVLNSPFPAVIPPGGDEALRAQEPINARLNSPPEVLNSPPPAVISPGGDEA
eukprot:1507637-Pyramimonas_sp.AAC.1